MSYERCFGGFARHSVERLVWVEARRKSAVVEPIRSPVAVFVQMIEPPQAHRGPKEPIAHEFR